MIWENGHVGKNIKREFTARILHLANKFYLCSPRDKLNNSRQSKHLRIYCVFKLYLIVA